MYFSSVRFTFGSQDTSGHIFYNFYFYFYKTYNTVFFPSPELKSQLRSTLCCTPCPSDYLQSASKAKCISLLCDS